MKPISAAAITALATIAVAGSAAARDQIQIVGSSTVFPYTQAVAEEFANKTGNASPVVESTGTGGGMKIFCQGVGEGHPDITGACDCRKPAPGLFRDAARDLGLDLARSVYIGDRVRDVAAAAALGGRAFLVRTGYGAEEARDAGPDVVVCDDVRDAAAAAGPPSPAR